MVWEWAGRTPSCQSKGSSRRPRRRARLQVIVCCGRHRAECCATVADCNGLPIGIVFSYHFAELTDYNGRTKGSIHATSTSGHDISVLLPFRPTTHTSLANLDTAVLLSIEFAVININILTRWNSICRLKAPGLAGVLTPKT
jgi:hypothetical protein